jgi:hypothetical protein
MLQRRDNDGKIRHGFIPKFERHSALALRVATAFLFAASSMPRKDGLVVRFIRCARPITLFLLTPSRRPISLAECPASHNARRLPLNSWVQIVAIVSPLAENPKHPTCRVFHDLVAMIYHNPIHHREAMFPRLRGDAVSGDPVIEPQRRTRRRDGENGCARLNVGPKAHCGIPNLTPSGASAASCDASLFTHRAYSASSCSTRRSTAP